MPSVVSSLDALRGRVRSAVEACCSEPDQRSELLSALARRGYALDGESPCRAGMLTIEACRSVGSEAAAAYDAAAAVELYTEAAFLFDDVADGGANPREGSTPSRELALAIALLTCGTAAASAAARRARAGVSETMLHLCRSYADACAGQWLDAALEDREAATIDDAFRMTCLKAGSFGRMAAGFGARMVTDNARKLELLERFGFYVFTYAQLVDDLRDACRPGEDCDLSQRKKTVPLVFYDHRGGNPRDRINRPSVETHAEYRASGAELYSAVVAEAVLNRAKATVNELGSVHCAVENLACFTDHLELDSTDALASSLATCA